MHYKSTILTRLTFLFCTIVILNSCDRQRNMKGYDFIPDMVYSQAYETNSDNPNFPDSLTMRAPVTGTVAMGVTPFRYTIDPESRLKAGKELSNPYLPLEEVIARGEYIFTTFCIGCHGSTGSGDGQLFASGLYPLKPRAISAGPTAKLKDGEIFHTVTLGFASMGPHGSQIKTEDRWKVVLYVRKLQNDAVNAADTIPAIKK